MATIEASSPHHRLQYANTDGVS